MRSIMLTAMMGLSLAIAGAAAAAGPVEVSNAWARATAPSAKTGVAYLTIANKGAADDRLVSAETPAAAKAEPHMTTNDNGVMKMRPVPAIAVKAGQQLELKPGGFHLMLVGLKAPLKEGQSIPLTLNFEKAGKVEVMVKVEKAGAMSPSMPGMKM
jgi:copper(I)-binding protein